MNKYYQKNKEKILKKKKEKLENRNAMLIAEGKTIPKRGRKSKEEKRKNLKDIFSKIIEDNKKMKIVEAIINKLKE